MILTKSAENLFGKKVFTESNTSYIFRKKGILEKTLRNISLLLLSFNLGMSVDLFRENKIVVY